MTMQPEGVLLSTPEPPSLARYRKLVIQLAAVATAGLLVLVDAVNAGGPVTAVTFWLVIGAIVQAVGTERPGDWWAKLLVSFVGVIFSGVAAGLTDGFSTAEILGLAVQITAWVAAGAVDNAQTQNHDLAA
jgi:hypothetical protein